MPTFHVGLRIFERADRLTEQPTDGRTDGRLNRQTDRYADEQIGDDDDDYGLFGRSTQAQLPDGIVLL